MIDKEDIDPTVEPTEDKIHRVIRAGIGLLPIGSGTAIELFNSIITPPIEKRRTKWMIDVSDALKKLESQKRFTLDDLSQNEGFISLLISASQIAIKNHSREKLDALRNSILNVASGANYEESAQILFLNLIDSFSPLHLRILKIFNEGFVWSNEGYSKPSDNEVPQMLVPSIGSYKELLDVDRDLLVLCLKDLVNNDLIWNWVIKESTRILPDDTFYCTTDQWGGRSTSEMLVKHGVALKHNRKKGTYVTRTSTLGRKFVEFISSSI